MNLRSSENQIDGDMMQSVDASAFYEEVAANEDLNPFAGMTVPDQIKRRADFVSAMWTDVDLFDRVLAEGKYIQLCTVTQMLIDRLGSHAIAKLVSLNASFQDRALDFKEVA